jgi:uncharacterized protein
MSVSLKCPCCRNQFKAMSLFSTNTCGPLTTDLHRHAGGLSPLSLTVHACTQCGYSGHEGDFSPEAVTPALKEWVQQNIRPIPARRGASAKFENSARIAEQGGASAYSVAHIWFRAGWCESEGSEASVRFRREAVSRFEAAMDKGQVPKDELATTTYLVGELHRRIGDTDKARGWFARVPEAAGDNAEQKWLVDLAIQQSTDPKEFVDEEPRR